MHVGTHIIADLYGVDSALIAKQESVRPIIEDVVKKAGLTIVGRIYKQFEPEGVTGILLIAESHLSLHTWPEYNLVNLEIFTCGEKELADRAFNIFLEYFQPITINRQELKRGVIHEPHPVTDTAPFDFGSQEYLSAH